jgi:hypothetical protein
VRIRGSACVSRAGERVLAIADFSFKLSIARDKPKERLFRRDAETNTRDACATRNIATAAISHGSLQKIISLSLANGSFKALEHLQHVFPDFAFFRRRLVSQQVSGVIRNHERDPAVCVPAPAQFAHRASGSKQAFHRNCAKRDQDFRLDDVNLLDQIRSAGLHLCRRWCAISKTS